MEDTLGHSTTPFEVVKVGLPLSFGSVLFNVIGTSTVLCKACGWMVQINLWVLIDDGLSLCRFWSDQRRGNGKWEWEQPYIYFVQNLLFIFYFLRLIYWFLAHERKTFKWNLTFIFFNALLVFLIQTCLLLIWDWIDI